MKFSTIQFTATSMCAIIAFGLAQLAHANLVQDGGFELTAENGTVPTYPSGQLGSDPGVNLTDWTVATGSYNFLFAAGTADTGGAYSTTFNNNVTLWGPGAGGGGVANGLPAASPAGGNFIAGVNIEAGAGGLSPGAISQVISGLSPGSTYVLSFYAAGAQQYGFSGATTDGWQVSLGGETQDSPTLSVPSHGFSPWQLDTLNFTATSFTETLSFLATGSPAGEPPTSLLDGVDLELAAPDAASTAVLLGLSAVALFAVPRLRGKH